MPKENLVCFSLVGKYVSCWNFYRFFFSLVFTQLQYFCHSLLYIFLCMFYVSRECKILCAWVCLWVCVLSKIKGEIHVPLCVERNKVPPSMCHYLTLKNWSLEKNATFDSTHWSWLLYKQCTHTHTHTYTQSEILCAYVITTHLFHIEALLHQNTFAEPPLIIKTIWKFFCIVKAVLELFSQSRMILPSWWWFIRGSSSQFVARMSFM